MKEQKRYLLIDGIRGLAIVNMVLFHFLYDVNEIRSRNSHWYEETGIHIWQQTICWTFIMVSGFVWESGKESAVRRGVILNMYGMLITAVTAVIMPTQVIWFGILNFMGCAAIITFLFYKQMKKIPAVFGIIINLLLFFLSRDLMGHKFGIEHLFQIHIPDFFYHIKILTFFGFPYEGFYSSDYFPVFPWIFLFLTGYFLHRYWTNKNGKHIDIYKSIPLLTWIGQKSIKIYLLHQPLCFALCSVIFAQIG